MTNTIMACIDGAQHATTVADCGAWLANRLDAPLTLLHVLDHHHGLHSGDFSGAIGLGAQEALITEMAKLDEQRSKLAMEQGALMLEAQVKRLAEQGFDGAQSRQRHGEVVQSLKELEAQTRIWVLGKKGGKDKGEHLLGAHVEAMVRALHQPVLLVAEQFTAPDAVLIAFDGSATGRKMVEVIAQSPIFAGLPCHLVMVAEDNEPNRSQLAWASAQLQATGHQCQGQILQGEVDKALCAYQQQHGIGLLVMGAYGHSRIRQFLLGSTTTTMLQSCQVPVLILR